MSKHWLTEFWSFQSVKKVKPSIDLRHVPELFCETYSACIRILSVPKFVSVLSIWPACFSNTLSLCILTWKVKGDYKNQIFFITQVNAALYKKHILHTFTSLLLSYKPLKGHILVFLKLLNLIYSICLSCHFLPPLTLLFLFAPSSVIFLCLSAKHPRAHWEWPSPQAPVLPGHPLNCLLMGVFLAIFISDTCSESLITEAKPGFHLQKKPWSSNLGENGTAVSLFSPVNSALPTFKSPSGVIKLFTFWKFLNEMLLKNLTLKLSNA